MKWLDNLFSGCALHSSSAAKLRTTTSKPSEHISKHHLRKHTLIFIGANNVVHDACKHGVDTQAFVQRGSHDRM